MIFWRVSIATNDDLQDAAVAELLSDFVGHIVGGGEIITIYFHLHCTHTTHAATAFVDVGFLDFRHGIEFGADFIGYLTSLAKTRLATFGLCTKAKVERHDVCAVASHGSKGIVGVGLTKAIVANLNFRNLHEVFGEALGESTCNILSCTRRQLNVDAQTAFVQLGHHLGL